VRDHGWAVAVATAAVFAPAVGHGFVSWDDAHNFVYNPDFRGLGWAQLRWMFTTAHLGHYAPVTWLTWGLDAALWGVNARAFHATSVALHALNAYLLYRLAAALLRAGSWAPGPRQLGAAAAALLWSLHPLRVEPVAWASARLDVVATLFALATVLAYLRAVRPGGAPAAGWLGAATGLFALALLSKSVVVTVPLALLALDAFPLGRLRAPAGTPWPRAAVALVAEKLPMLVLAAGAGVLMMVINARQEHTTPLEATTLVERAALAVHAAGFTVQKTLVPLGLTQFYELRGALGSWTGWIGDAALVTALSALAVAGRRRWPAIPAAWLACLLLLLPVSGLFQKGVPVAAADRYTYLPAIPLALLLGTGAAWCADAVRRRGGPVRPGIVVAALLAVCLALAGLSAIQLRVWRDSERLWRHAVAVDPGSAFAHYHLAGVLAIAGRIPEARVEYEEALARLDRRRPRTEALFRARLGSVLQAQGELPAAERHYREALRLYPRNLRARANLAVILSGRGEDARALEEIVEALRQAPGFAEACAIGDPIASRLGVRPAELASCP
jgi:tetratricopeptide (TPR) repeat protein